jgi:uncharacterized protein with HEPN domain
VKHSSRDWLLDALQRNRIAHAYGFTSPVKLRQTVIEDVADFEASVRRLLEQVPE